VIPPSLRHEYWVEISVGQAGIVPLALLLFAPFVGAGLGAFAGGFANRSRGTRGRAGGGSHAASPPAPVQPLGRLRASDADREQAISVLKAAFAQGRLTKGEFDARVGTRSPRRPARTWLGSLPTSRHADRSPAAFLDAVDG
jgi:Domain of unknown function (DUF1707)